MSAHQLNKLVVWQKAIALAKEIYLISEALPTDEKFGLTSQMKRCAISIPSLILQKEREEITQKSSFIF
ncbi:four helix bundle protein [Riemerella anatipestifer]|uniref:four helix bundle protein n=1 Tax=Riemerella anatipestifer TaxID=34085 RepID=UPI003F4E5B39